MAKPKNLVDSFLFQNAKKAVDLISNDKQTDNREGSISDQNANNNISVSDQNKSSIISLSDHEEIGKGADKEQIHISSVAGKEHVQISSKDHDGITTQKIKNDITKGAVSISLAKSQTAVYLWFLDRGETGLFNKPEIQYSLSMPYITVRKAVTKLETLGIIELSYDGCQKIYEYRINKDKRLKLSKNISNISGAYQDQKSIVSESLISSSSLNKTTTDEIKKDLTINPELGYWRQKGLTAKLIADWMKVADCSYDSMVEYLCYCRFEMVDKNLENSKPVENVFNWFFKIIEKTGSYPKPKGYKTFAEKQLEQERWIVEQKEKQAQEAKELYRRKFEAARDKEFWEMMGDEAAELYKKCFKRLNNFQKKRKEGRGFEMSMRKAFDDLMDGDQAEDAV